MKKCSYCGKEFDVLYPDLWRYKDGKGFNVTDWYCRYNCMQANRKRKEEEHMARTRKDGTPAKKPGRKPRMETVEKLPDLPKVELVYDESIAEEYKKEQLNRQAEEHKEPKAGTEWTDAAEVYGIAVDEEDDKPIRPEKPLNVIRGIKAEDAQVTAIRFPGLGEFYFDSKYGTVDWRSNEGEEISLTPADWTKLAEKIPEMLRLLGADD